MTLQTYLEEVILPKYAACDEGHRQDHILYVLNRSVAFATQWNASHPTAEQVNLDMVKTIAVFHDLGLTVADRKVHHIVSAQLLMADTTIAQFFTEEQRSIMADAVEDHRASHDGEPRTVYGRIVSQADRDVSSDSFLTRMYIHRRNNPDFRNFWEMRMDAYKYMSEKYGQNGYGTEKFWFNDNGFDEFIKTMKHYIDDPYDFANNFRRIAASCDARALAYSET